VLVTGINPTPAARGEIHCHRRRDPRALRKIGRNAALCIREPVAWAGPSALKGGAAGGGYAQVVPMEDINLHFTVTSTPIASAHNLLSPCWTRISITATRSVSTRVASPGPAPSTLNDRALRNIIVGLGLNAGPAREERFVIIPGSEIMAIMALATGIEDLEQRLARIIVG